MAKKDLDEVRRETIARYFKNVWDSKKNQRSEGTGTQEDFASRLGVSQGAIGHYLNGRTMIDIEFATAFCAYLGISISDIDINIRRLITPTDQFQIEDAIRETHLEYSKGKMGSLLTGIAPEPPVTAIQDYTFVPKSSLKAGMGHGAFEFDSEQVVDTLAFKTSWIIARGYDPRRLALITCVGDSMQPTLMDGDLTLVDLREARASDGLFAIAVDDNIRIKRLRVKLDGTLTVFSDNDRYDPEQYSPDEAESLLRVIGRVVWVGREFD